MNNIEEPVLKIPDNHKTARSLLGWRTLDKAITEV